MKFDFTILIYSGLFFIFQASGKVNMIGSTKVNRGWNKHEWVLSAPSACSVTCGEGVQTSVYECRNIKQRKLMPSFYCLHTVMPEAVYNPCVEQTCKPVWLVSDWNRCNVTCGFGMTTRAVKCGVKNKDRQPSFVHERYCIGSRPVEYKACKDKMCPIWKTGRWSKCSVTCGQGFTWRKVQCISVDQTACPSNKAPKSKKICYQGICLDFEKKPIVDMETKEIEKKEKVEIEEFPGENEMINNFNGIKNETVVLGGDEEIDSNDYDIEFRKRFNEGDRKKDIKNQRNLEKTPEPKKPLIKESLVTPSCKEKKEVKIKNYRYLQTMPYDEYSISLVIADDETIVYVLTNSSINLICNDNDNSTIWYHKETVVSKDQGYKLQRVTTLQSGVYICFGKSKVSKVALVVLDDVIDMKHLQKETEDKFTNHEESIDIITNSNLNKLFTLRLALVHQPPYNLNTFLSQEQFVCYVSTNLFTILLDMSLCEQERAGIVPFISTDVTTYEWKHTDWSNCSMECAGNGVGRREREVWCQTTEGLRVDNSECIKAGLEVEPSVIPCPKTDCIAYWKAHQYSECIGVCGRYGVRTRRVECTIGAYKVVQNELCENDEKPEERLQCRVDCDEVCIDTEKCKEFKAEERCNDDKIEHCCHTCNRS